MAVPGFVAATGDAAPGRARIFGKLQSTVVSVPEAPPEVRAFVRLPITSQDPVRESATLLPQLDI